MKGCINDYLRAIRMSFERLWPKPIAAPCELGTFSAGGDHAGHRVQIKLSRSVELDFGDIVMLTFSCDDNAHALDI
jgi:hypothetical protein